MNLAVWVGGWAVAFGAVNRRRSRSCKQFGGD